MQSAFGIQMNFCLQVAKIQYSKPHLPPIWRGHYNNSSSDGVVTDICSVIMELLSSVVSYGLEPETTRSKCDDLP